MADNIRVGRPEASDDEVAESVRRLDCWDLLARLPQGLQTHVGERGVSLSVGQRQLVCFARALIADPRILILDEATSSIDSETEPRIQTALRILLAIAPASSSPIGSARFATPIWCWCSITAASSNGAGTRNCWR